MKIKNLISLIIVIATISGGITTVEAKTAKKKSTTKSSSSLSLKSFTDRFNFNNLMNVSPRKITPVMKQLGFSLQSSTETNHNVEEADFNYINYDATDMHFKRGNIYANVFIIHYGPISSVYEIVLTFMSNSDCQKFMDSTKSAFGNKLKGYGDFVSFDDKKTILTWDLKREGSTITIRPYETLD